MTIFTPTNPAPWATDATYPAGAQPWSGGPTRINPGSPALAAGAAPLEQPSAQVTNYQLGTIGDTLDKLAKIALHTALQTWDSVEIPNPAGADIYTKAVGMRSTRAYGTMTEAQRRIVLIGADTGDSNKLRVARSTDGTAIQAGTSKFAATTNAKNGYPGAAGELVVTNDNNVFAYSTNSGSSWTGSAIALAGPPVIQTFHYVPSGANAGYYIAMRNASAFGARASSLANLVASPTTMTIPTVGGFAFDDGKVEFASNGDGSVLLLAGYNGSPAIYRSLDAGATWTVSLNDPSATGSVNLVWSEYHGAFIAWFESGELFRSTDGSTWTLLASGKTPAVGFSAGRSTLHAVGIAIVKATSSGGNGIVYSLDLGAHWHYWYFDQFEGNTIVSLTTINNRLYAVDGNTGLRLYRSLPLGAPTVAEI